MVKYKVEGIKEYFKRGKLNLNKSKKHIYKEEKMCFDLPNWEITKGDKNE